MERYIAVDNVCAWPNLTRMPDGEIIAVGFNQPCHASWEGDVECWASGDDGRMWERRGVPCVHDPGCNRMNHAAGLAHSGDLIVVASGWDGRIAPYSGPAWFPPGDTDILAPMVSRSSDNGRTWKSALEAVQMPDGIHHPIPFGEIIRFPDGDLGMSVYSWTKQERSARNSYFLRSHDDGETWGDAALIGAGRCGEPTCLLMDDRRMLAAVRGRGLTLFASDDAGRTWEQREQLTMNGEMPGHLLKLSDGKILLSHGIRRRGCYGVGALYSEDDGEHWSIGLVVVNLDDAYDGGYPSTVELDDGRLLTAYYASQVPSHRRYHMGVVIWDLDEVADRNTWPESMRPKPPKEKTK